MVNPLQEDRMKSFDDLLDSDKIIEVRYQILETFADNLKFQNVLRENRTISRKEANENNTKHAISYECAEIDFFSYLSFKDSWVENKYKIHVPSIPSFPHFELGIFNPYQEKLQELMDLSIQAGLPKFWNMAYELRAIEIFHQNEGILRVSGSNLEILDISSLIPMFFILLIGLTASLFVFLIEILHYNFLSKLSRGFL